MSMNKYIEVVFDGPPSHEAGRFVEVENEDGASIHAGEWIEREDGLWALRIERKDAALRDMSETTRVNLGWEGCRRIESIYGPGSVEYDGAGNPVVARLPASDAITVQIPERTYWREGRTAPPPERTDTERLDWLEANAVQVDGWEDGSRSIEDLRGLQYDAPTVRAAIDAAMDATPEPEEES